MSYILKQYDYDLAYFDVFYDIEGFRVENFKIEEKNMHLLPLNLKQDNEGMAKWLKNRSIPKNREFVDKFLSKLGLNHNNTKGIIDICKGLRCAIVLKMKKWRRENRGITLLLWCYFNN